MRRLWLLPLVFVAAPALGQETPSFSLGGDATWALPLGEFADDGGQSGYGLGATASVRLTRLLGLYGRYAYYSFGVEDAPDYPEDRWTDHGLGAGVRVWIPTRRERPPIEPRVQPWVQVGLSYRFLDRPIAHRRFAPLTDDGLWGLEAEGGFDIAVARRFLFLRPVLRYRRYGFEVTTQERTYDTTISYLALGLGARLELD